jgi:hypothetical protein
MPEKSGESFTEADPWTIRPEKRINTATDSLAITGLFIALPTPFLRIE